MPKDVGFVSFSATRLAINAAHCKLLLVEVQDDGLPQLESPKVPSRLRGTSKGDAFER